MFLSDNDSMYKDTYIEQLEKQIIELKKRIEELERLLGMNSRNSSKPPSSDLPKTLAKPTKQRRKKRGAKKGHQPHLRELLPPEKVTKRIKLEPKECTCGSESLEPSDQEPLRHQFIDVPPIVPEVIEYLQLVYRCKDCGEFVYAPLPDEVKRTYFGPGVFSLVGILTGDLNTSKRKALAIMNEVFSVPMSLGGLSVLCVRLFCGVSAVLAHRANAAGVMWSEFSRCVRPAACKSEALSHICVKRVVAIRKVFLFHNKNREQLNKTA